MGLLMIVAGFLLMLGGVVQLSTDQYLKTELRRLESLMATMTDTDNHHTSSIKHLTSAVTSLTGLKR